MKLVLKQGDSDYLMHYRVGGEKKGVRRWQNKDGSYTPEGYQHYADMYGWGAASNKAVDDFLKGKVRNGTADQTKSETSEEHEKAYQAARKEVQKIGQKAKDKVRGMIAKAKIIGVGGAAVQAAYSVMKFNEASGLRQTLIGVSSGVAFGGSQIQNTIKQARALVNYSGDFLRNGADMIGKIAQGSDAVRVLAGSQANAVAVLGTAGVAALGAGIISSAAVASYCGIRYAVKKHQLKKNAVEHADDYEMIDESDIDSLDDSVKLALLMVLDAIAEQST